MGDGEFILETNDLQRRFGGVRAVDGVDFHLRQGELRCLIGPNGAGKSTFFKLLSGQLRPSGGTIRFGKLTMTDADLQLIDADPKDPFDFYPARYDAQLVAGYSKNTPSKGLKTYMPDYGELR